MDKGLIKRNIIFYAWTKASCCCFLLLLAGWDFVVVVPVELMADLVLVVVLRCDDVWKKKKNLKDLKKREEE